MPHSNGRNQLTESALLSGLIRLLLGWAHALVAALGVDALGGVVTRVSPLCVVETLVDVETLRALGTVVQSAPVTGLTPAVVPAGHVEARGRLVTTVQLARALV